MTTKRAGEAAKVGLYFNTRTWEIGVHRKSVDALPGAAGDRYVRLPALALLFLGPIMGFLFVVFLPLIGFALVVRELGHKMTGWSGKKAHDAAAVKSPFR